jgi:hypothetical protein
MIPLFLRVCIRTTIPAKDWYSVEDCVGERYQKVLAQKGQKAADRWARSEAIWFVIEGLKRMVHPRTWLSWFGLGVSS